MYFILLHFHDFINFPSFLVKNSKKKAIAFFIWKYFLDFAK